MNQIPSWKTNRKILGMSAILLPFTNGTEIDWQGFRNHVNRTLEAGLVPAVNMDTGYANLIDEQTRVRVLEETQAICAGEMFVAGAFVADSPGDQYDAGAYQQQIKSIVSFSGTPVIFQSFGLTTQGDEELVAAYREFSAHTNQFIGFELGKMFAPFGKIYSSEVYEQLLGIPACIGAKHSSLNRHLEWERIAIRDRLREDFHVFTGNDLAIDMVMYGSDYLLGLSTMAPDVFAKRDKMWEKGDPEFFHLNDWLQYLGFFAFRNPVPAYKHTAAQFLKLRGWIETDLTHPQSPQRPESDIAILKEMLQQHGL